MKINDIYCIGIECQYNKGLSFDAIYKGDNKFLCVNKYINAKKQYFIPKELEFPKEKIWCIVNITKSNNIIYSDSCVTIYGTTVNMSRWCNA